MKNEEAFNDRVKKLVEQDLERAKKLSKESKEKADRIFDFLQFGGNQSLDSIVAKNPIDGMTLLMLLSKAISHHESKKASSKNADMREYIEGFFREEFNVATDIKREFAQDAVNHYLPGQFPGRTIPTADTVEGWLPTTGTRGRKKKQKK